MADPNRCVRNPSKLPRGRDIGRSHERSSWAALDLTRSGIRDVLGCLLIEGWSRNVSSTGRLSTRPEGNFDHESPSAPWVGAHVGTVGVSDRLHDREPQPMPVPVMGANAVESLAGPLFATETKAPRSRIPVVTSTSPPGTLWRIALSTKLTIRRSSSRGSPPADAAPSIVRTPRPASCDSRAITA